LAARDAVSRDNQDLSDEFIREIILFVQSLPKTESTAMNEGLDRLSALMLTIGLHFKPRVKCVWPLRNPQSGQ
jgi:hypothetical protein